MAKQMTEIERLRDQRNVALKALRSLWARIEDGTLCRDISRDHEPTWALRMMELTESLKEAQQCVKNSQYW